MSISMQLCFSQLAVGVQETQPSANLSLLACACHTIIKYVNAN